MFVWVVVHFANLFLKSNTAYIGFIWICTFVSFHSKKVQKVGRKKARTIGAIL